MKKANKALLVFFSGKSNAGGAERMVQYLEEYLQSHGLQTEIIDEAHLLNTLMGKLYKHIFRHRHFQKRRTIYLARFASAYLWLRKKPKTIVFSNGESTPFYPVDFVISQGCYHVMEVAYGWAGDKLSRISRLQMAGCKRAKHIIGVTEKVKADLIHFYQVPAENISIVGNRVDSSVFVPLPKQPKQGKIVLYAGRLEVGKGLQTIVQLAEVIEQSTDWNFLIACNNPGNAHLFQHFTRTQIKVGLGFHNINKEAYSLSDLVIFPSHYESFGMITPEALSAGIPVIATPVGIVPDLLAKNYPGVYLLEPFSGSEILERFDAILEDFAQLDRHALHEQVKVDFGIETYRLALDGIMKKFIKF